MCSARDDGGPPPPGCPIRTSSDRRVPAAPRGVSSRGHVLLRPQAPRHPPCAFRADLRNATLASSPPGSHVTWVVRFLNLRCIHPCPARVSRPPCPTREPATPTKRRRPRAWVSVRTMPVSRPHRHAHPHLVRCSGGAAGSRTPDLRRAKAALSQLSYSPVVDIRATHTASVWTTASRRTVAPRWTWWAFVDSNHGPHPYQGCALTN